LFYSAPRKTKNRFRSILFPGIAPENLSFILMSSSENGRKYPLQLKKPVLNRTFCWPHPSIGTINFFTIMSQHPSLRRAAALGGKRNVLKRFERVELMKKRGQWKEGDRVIGLAKTKLEA
jgi:small basic protein (TIGR04137 family)